MLDQGKLNQNQVNTTSMILKMTIVMDLNNWMILIILIMLKRTTNNMIVKIQ